jgi:LPXTG-motif cell wall-anchored protein
VTLREMAVAVAVAVWIVAVFLFLPQSGDNGINPIPLALLGSVVIVAVGLFLRRRA